MLNKETEEEENIENIFINLDEFSDEEIDVLYSKYSQGE
jgi:hypothetical protein